MIATIAPNQNNVENTLNTLRYASRVKELKEKCEPKGERDLRCEQSELGYKNERSEGNYRGETRALGERELRSERSERDLRGEPKSMGERDLNNRSTSASTSGHPTRGSLDLSRGGDSTRGSLDTIPALDESHFIGNERLLLDDSLLDEHPLCYEGHLNEGEIQMENLPSCGNSNVATTPLTVKKIKSGDLLSGSAPTTPLRKISTVLVKYIFLFNLILIFIFDF